MKKIELIGQATPEQIAEWKAKYGVVKAIIVDGHIAYFKKPDRKIIGYASSIGTKDPMKFNETMMNNCFIGGSEAIKKDDDLFLSASSKLGELINIKEAELVNL